MMRPNLTSSRHFLVATLGVSLACTWCMGGQKKKKAAQKGASKDQAASAEPDKVLYDRAMLDIKHGRYTEGQLSLQALINTYPDSEYLAKAKLAMGDSFYKAGGTSNFVQAINQYKDFITFFPFLDEAAYAQMQVAMAHYRMMEKSDRDSTQVQAAEDEFQTFLLKYPRSKLVPQAEQRLREVQEVLADGEFKIGKFYYVKQDYNAGAARLLEVTDRYPLYSQDDEALWLLGDIYSRAKQVSKNEDDKNHWADLAGTCYSHIVKDYPLSRLAQQAKGRLTAMGMAVPPPDPQALARMKKQQMYEKKHHESVIKLPLALLKTGPNVAVAARGGQPNLNPPTDTISATEVLRPGAVGPTFGSFGLSGKIDTGAPESDSNSTADPIPAVSSSTAPIGSAGVQIIAAPTTDSSTPATVTPPAGGAFPPAGTTITPTPQNQNPASAAPQPPGPGSSTAQPAKPTEEKLDKNTESTSKKKKGVKKLIPW